MVRRVQDAFVHTPELKLTPRRAQAFFDVDETACRAVLETLADANVVMKRPDGIFISPIAHAA